MSRATISASVLSLVVAAVFAAGSVRAEDAPRRAIDLQNTKCPVTGSPIARGVTAEVNGAIVHFCCPKCPPKYREHPGAYEAALRSDPAVARRLDEANAAALGAPAAPAGPAHADPSHPPTAEMSKGAAFHDAMRKLWEDHVWWTRLFVVSATGDLPDKDATTNRLLKNQEDIGNAIKPIYGDEAGTKLTTLLKEHITTAADLVTASKAKDSAKAEAAKAKWFTNADEIAAFLSGANPKAWPLDAAKAMMREHLDLTIAEVTARLGGDWEGDIAA